MNTSPAAAERAPRTEPSSVVRAFLLALEAGELDEALSFLTEDVVWTNVSLPTIRGRAKVERVLRPGHEKLRAGFRVFFHTIAASGATVLTERTDALILGPLEVRAWVYGRFEIVDGRITVWRDSFDWLDFTVGFVRAVAGMFMPSLNRPWPGAQAPGADSNRASGRADARASTGP
jgi:limonene-1,2-epoxide hydrolase